MRLSFDGIDRPAEPLRGDGALSGQPFVARAKRVRGALVVLVALLLTGCHFSHSCAFGAWDDAHAAYCAEKNFGASGAAYIAQRTRLCRECGTAYGDLIGADQQYCVLNCFAED